MLLTIRALDHSDCTDDYDVVDYSDVLNCSGAEEYNHGVDSLTLLTILKMLTILMMLTVLIVK
jgi:hypothetical protein